MTFLLFIGVLQFLSLSVLERDCEEKLKELNDTLQSRIPELVSIGAPFIQKMSQGKAHLVVLLEDCPAANSDDTIRQHYYEMYVGESHETHNVRWYHFYIHKNLKEILIYDPAEDSYSRLEDVRQSESWKRDWKSRERK